MIKSTHILHMYSCVVELCGVCVCARACVVCMYMCVCVCVVCVCVCVFVCVFLHACMCVNKTVHSKPHLRTVKFTYKHIHQ